MPTEINKYEFSQQNNSLQLVYTIKFEEESENLYFMLKLFLSMLIDSPDEKTTMTLS